MYCTALHCTALHCTALYSTLLYCTVSNGCEALDVAQTDSRYDDPGTIALDLGRLHFIVRTRPLEMSTTIQEDGIASLVRSHTASIL